ncbi:hypothetical protein FRC10_000901 [Ceratobasidium sp. 414]|nr:hypothetical protein FRC10_000901 [Ceratobasidium sp. 414]
MLATPPRIDGDGSPEPNLDTTYEDSEQIQFKAIMELVVEKKVITDVDVLESLGPLATPGKIPEIVVGGLKGLNTRLETPIDPATVLYLIGELCVSQNERLDRLELIDVAIDCYSRAISIAAPGVLDETHVQSVLGNLYWRRFLQLGEVADIDTAIARSNHAAALTPDGSLARLVVLRDLGLSYRARFDHLKEGDDIDTAISYHTQAVLLVSDDDPDKPTHIGHLGNSYARRFEYSREPSDLEQSIAYHSQAAAMTPDGHPRRAGMLNNLAGSHLWRFESLENLEDLNTAISYYSLAASLTPDDDKHKPGMLCSLGRSHGRRFQQLKELADMDADVICHTQAVPLIPNGHPRKAEMLEKLGDSHNRRFNHLGELADLEGSINFHSQAVALTPGTHSSRPDRLHSLGLSYYARYERFGELKDLSAAITCHSEAVSLISDKHPRRLRWLNNLGSLLGTRFEYTGELSDLETATVYHDQAASMTPDTHPDKPIMLNGLGNLHARRFKRLGEVADIDKAIMCYDRAVSLAPVGHPAKRTFLDNLGGSYKARFQYLRSQADSDMALGYFNEAVLLTPDENPDKPGVLHNLGSSHSTRFEYSQQLSDLDIAITCHNLALSLTPNGHPSRSNGMNCLGIAHSLRFERLGELADLEQAIQCYTRAISVTPEDHPRKSTALNNLGGSHFKRFLRLGELADLNTSVEYRSQAVSLLPPEDPRRPFFLGNLADSHFIRHKNLGDDNDGTLAADCYMQAAQSTTGQPLLRLTMARQWANLSIIRQSSTILDAYKQVMALIPQAVWLGSTTERRYENVMNIGGVALEAATFAIHLQNYSLALEWLEQGRSIVWNQLLELRTPLDELAVINPMLAEDLEQTSQRLDHTLSIRSDNLDVTSDRPSFEEAAQQHRRLAERWGQLVQQAQTLPGLEEFLRPKKAHELMEAARTTAVVMVLVHEYGCHALIMNTQAETFGQIIELEDFTYNKASDARAQMASLLRTQGRNTRGVGRGLNQGDQFRKILHMLWVDLVKPILNVLEYSNEVASDQLPHITWCLTGPLAFLPLHAAGDYSTPGCTLFDYAISSYTPNLASLLVPPLDFTLFSGSAAVGQTATPGFSPLPGTEAELGHISLRLNSAMPFTRLEGEKATASAVLAAMEQHSWVHLACHASQDPKKPTASAFHLHDGPLDLATITRKRLKHADLAFLSACQTATGDHDLPDEAVHLAAGMIMAGYRRVIATMWSIEDKDAPLVADRFYEYMLDESVPNRNKAAKALHYAVGSLRAEVGVKEFARWAPYIHIGQ